MEINENYDENNVINCFLYNVQHVEKNAFQINYMKFVDKYTYINIK